MHRVWTWRRNFRFQLPQNKPPMRRVRRLKKLMGETLLCIGNIFFYVFLLYFFYFFIIMVFFSKLTFNQRVFFESKSYMSGCVGSSSRWCTYVMVGHSCSKIHFANLIRLLFLFQFQCFCFRFNLKEFRYIHVSFESTSPQSGGIPKQKIKAYLEGFVFLYLKYMGRIN